MECFCKGAVLGMLAGVCVGAIVVAKNKKLSNKLNEGLVIAEEKFKEIKDNLEDKMSQGQCECDNCDCVSGDYNSMSFATESDSGNFKNNFSKKDKK